MKRTFLLLASVIVALTSSLVRAHDTWVQSGSLVTRYQDVVHIDLMLGNHGNNHRDFKLASKITLAPCTLEIIAPNGSRTDLKSKVVDMGSAEKEGFWTAKMIADQKGTYQVVHTLDTLHGKTRAIKSGKSYFIASDRFDAIPKSGKDPVQPLGKGLEFQLDTPLETIAANREIKLRVLWNGKPLPNTSVAFVPRGAKLAEDTDPQFERVSDAGGYVTYTPSEGNFLLAVTHYVAADEKGEGYDKTHYGATLVLPVPQTPFTPSL
jgi:uncharacterized GH25 family protein